MLLNARNMCSAGKIEAATVSRVAGGRGKCATGTSTIYWGAEEERMCTPLAIFNS